MYTGFSHNFSTYGSALALFFLLAAWLYFLAEFILLGAVANRMHVGEPDARGLLGARDRSSAGREGDLGPMAGFRDRGSDV